MTLFVFLLVLLLVLFGVAAWLDINDDGGSDR